MDLPEKPQRTSPEAPKEVLCRTPNDAKTRRLSIHIAKSELSLDACPPGGYLGLSLGTPVGAKMYGFLLVL